MTDYAAEDDTHSLAIGYILWIFGFLGAHRFYFGRPVSGTIYFFTLGLFLIGWIVDLFLMPRLEELAERRYRGGAKNYSIAYLLLTFTGVFGFHRIYLGKVFTGLLYLVTLGLFGIGIIYDFWTLNEQVHAVNSGAP